MSKIYSYKRRVPKTFIAIKFTGDNFEEIKGVVSINNKGYTLSHQRTGLGITLYYSKNDEFLNDGCVFIGEYLTITEDKLGTIKEEELNRDFVIYVDCLF